METVIVYIPWSFHGSESCMMRTFEWLGEQGMSLPLIRKKAELLVISNFSFYVISPCKVFPLWIHSIIGYSYF